MSSFFFSLKRNQSEALCPVCNFGCFNFRHTEFHCMLYCWKLSTRLAYISAGNETLQTICVFPSLSTLQWQWIGQRQLPILHSVEYPLMPHSFPICLCRCVMQVSIFKKLLAYMHVNERNKLQKTNRWNVKLEKKIASAN